MTARTKPGPPLRSAELSRVALTANLTALRTKHGEDAAVDLRANALGLGSAEVAKLAHDVGFRHCVVDPWDTVPPGLESIAAGVPAISGWWDGQGGPVVSFGATVISVKAVPSGTAVSYGYEYTTTTDTTLALVSAGFADGVPRVTGGKIALGGVTFPIAGRIAMDQCVVDIGNASVEVGQRAVIWGSSPSLAQWSLWSHRPESALLAHLGSRVVKTWH